MTSWTELLAEFNDPIIACTLSDKEMAKEFDDDFGGDGGPRFTAWSEDWVYFPLTYDTSEWVGRAPRNICDHSCEHMGG